MKVDISKHALSSIHQEINSYTRRKVDITSYLRMDHGQECVSTAILLKSVVSLSSFESWRKLNLITYFHLYAGVKY